METWERPYFSVNPTSGSSSSPSGQQRFGFVDLFFAKAIDRCYAPSFLPVLEVENVCLMDLWNGMREVPCGGDVIMSLDEELIGLREALKGEEEEEMMSRRYWVLVVMGRSGLCRISRIELLRGLIGIWMLSVKEWLLVEMMLEEEEEEEEEYLIAGLVVKGLIGLRRLE